MCLPVASECGPVWHRAVQTLFFLQPYQARPLTIPEKQTRKGLPNPIQICNNNVDFCGPSFLGGRGETRVVELA
jgi:hypothetical protein